MAWIIIVASVAFSLLISVALLKQSVLPKLSAVLVIFSSLLIITGAGLIYLNSRVITEGMAAKSWSRVTGIVINSEIAGKRAFHPEITFRYAVNGHVYDFKTDLGTPGFGNKRSRLDTAERIIRDYQIGDSVNVYYDPSDPVRATLRTGPPWHAFVKLGLGIIVLIMGSMGCARNFLPPGIARD